MWASAHISLFLTLYSFKMKNKILVILLLVYLFPDAARSQSKYELNGGVSISNTNRYSNSHQDVNVNPNGSPDYALRYHLGIQRKLLHFSNFNFQIGLGIANRGSKNTEWLIYPIDTILDLNLIYFQAPVNFNFRLLNEKEYYFTLGLTPSYLLFRYDNITDELSDASANPTLIPWQLEYKLGIRFPVVKKLDGMLSFNRNLTSYRRERSFNVPTWKAGSYNYTFDLTLIYKL